MTIKKMIVKFNGQELNLNIRDEADRSVMREIYKLREYRIVEPVIATATSPILDIGAHAGFFSLYCRVLNPLVKIFAVEPLQENLEMFAEHLKMNKITGVKVIEGALAGITEERKLVVTEDKHNNYLDSGIRRNDSDKIRNDNADSPVIAHSFPVIPAQAGIRKVVQAYSYRDFCEKNKIKKISLLKMDIEGGEYEVFDAMKDEDFAKISAIILEYHNDERNYQEIENKLRENGFGVQTFPSKFDKKMGFVFGNNKS